MKYLVLFFSLVLCSCSNDDDFSATHPNVVPISSNDVVGTWRISLYEDSGVNETADFSGFIFDFKADKKLNVTYDNILTVGAWKINPGNSTGELYELEINIPTDKKPLEELNDDWDVNFKSNSTIELFEISGGDGHLEKLNFTRL